MTLSTLTYQGASYPSIEHAFQASKYRHLTGGERLDLIKQFMEGEIYGKMLPLKIKGKGGKGEMRKKKVTLDVDSWNDNRLQVMSDLIAARAESDEHFANLIRFAQTNGIALLHMENTRGRGEAFWGGTFEGKSRQLENFVGANNYGRLLSELM